MSYSYICKKCNYNTQNFKDLKKHLLKKKSCQKCFDSLNLSNDEIIIKTVLPYIGKKHILNDSEIDKFKNSNIVYENKDELFRIIDNIDKNKLKKCECCNKDFIKIIDLKKHMVLDCFLIHIDNLKKRISENTNAQNITSNIVNNSHNNINSNNTTNNINIYLEVKKPIPFDDDWDTSLISNDRKGFILFTKIMYTSLLEDLLKNEINLNVIIDKENDSGFVYKNDIEKYIQMRSNDIVKNTMDKLRNHLTDFRTSNENIIDKEHLTHCRRMIEKKFLDYTNNEETQEIVNDLICNIFQKKKNNAIKISKNINMDKNEKNNDFNIGF
jgi:hypothetical protein